VRAHRRARPSAASAQLTAARTGRDCAKWVCIDLALSHDLEAQLNSKVEVPATIFNDAQRQVFVNMVSVAVGSRAARP